MKFDIIGIGGVLDGEHVEEYIRAGADAIQSATGASSNLGLATEVAARYRKLTEDRGPWLRRALATGGMSLITRP